MAFDVNALPAFYVGKYGLDRFAEVTGKSKSVTAMQLRRNKVTLEDVSKLLAFDPSPLAEVRPLYTNPEPGKKLAILVPLSGPPEPKTMDCLIKLFNPAEMTYERRAFNNLSVARASLAASFLRSPCDWSWWHDGDSIVPCGDAEWYKDAAGLPDLPDVYAGFNAIFRALWHKKSIVSCSYVSKTIPAVPQFGGGAAAEMITLVRKGPQNKLIERSWSGMGGVLIHRKVFEDIIASQGDEIRMKPGGIGERFGYTYAFFQPLDCETCGDDIPLFIRAAKAGHKCFVDLAIQAAHIGDRAYSFKDV